MRESTVEKYFVERVRWYGGEVRKVKWIGRRHAPDRVAFFPDGVVWWVELKRPKKDATAGQAREHERMRNLGQYVQVLNTLQAVDKALPR